MKLHREEVGSEENLSHVALNREILAGQPEPYSRCFTLYLS